MNSDIADTQSFKNRKPGLVIFGVLTIIGGCICLLFALLAAAAPTLAARSSSPPPVPVNPLPGVLMYVCLAVTFVWLGIGSVMARRWARALLAVLSWTFLVFGVCGLVFLGMMAPHLKEGLAAARPPNQPMLPDSAQTGIVVGIFVFAAMLNVVGPLIWALFYSGRSVKATCEALDPIPRWTDRCPLPVLAISLWLLFGAIMMLSLSMFYPVAPLFGVLLTGTAARVYHVGLAVIWLYASWALFRLDRRGWWIVFIVMIASAVSGLITFSRHDFSELYVLMGVSSEQIAMTQKFGFTNRITLWSTLFGTVPLIVYLVWIRKFFSRPVNNAMWLGN